ncbi:hypothetical protein BDC45DRAFT_571682 [Circinella umbellata]|nr:hypothetical protein BDC45DRAFT_571682 [Circinella umbellata]
MPAITIFILERFAKATVPSGLEETGKTLSLLEKSHNDYMEEDLFGDLEENDKREDLRKIVATKVVKPIRGLGYGPLLPKRYDVSFDSTSPIHPN